MVEKHSYSTDFKQVVNRFGEWSDLVNSVYFPLSIRKCQMEKPFYGYLKNESFGYLQISHLESDPLCYQREESHIGRENKDYFLVTIPKQSSVHFAQNGKEIECQPGEFFIEGSNDPYVFDYQNSNQMTVLKLPGLLLRDRISMVENYCAIRLQGSSGSGALFVDFLNSIVGHMGGVTDDLSLRYSEQLVDLLAISLETSGNSTNGIGIPSVETAVQQAYLRRICRYIDLHLSDANLSPKKIATECGISVRYLHLLFKETEWTVSSWVREMRLQKCYSALINPYMPIRSFADLAYRWGFSDQAGFNRNFKARFDMTPKQARIVSKEV